jgi:uncharacterized protein YuzE
VNGAGPPGRRVLAHLGIKRDPEADAAYLALTEIGPGEAVETIPIHDRAGDLLGAVDLDANGCVLGIEFLNAGRRLPWPTDP